MKAILEFNLPTDNLDYDLANKRFHLYTALLGVRGALRNYAKYTDLEGVSAQEVIDDLWENFSKMAAGLLEDTQ
jgi:hypothetical protein